MIVIAIVVYIIYNILYIAKTIPLLLFVIILFGFGDFKA